MNYAYYPSSGQNMSNEISQAYFLERTQSATSVLEKGNELCLDKVNNTYRKFILFVRIFSTEGK